MSASRTWAGGVVCLTLWLTFGLADTRTPADERPTVAEEFSAAVARIAARGASRPLDAIDFPPCEAQFIRITIHETNNGSQPGIDELEIYGPDHPENLALAQRGAEAAASSVIPGYAIHAIAHLNDGRYGNDFSWISANVTSEWAQIKLPAPETVSRVTVTRDRSGAYQDRIPEVYDVQCSMDGEHWDVVARRDRTPGNRARRLPYFPVERLTTANWDGLLRYALLRERETWSHIPTDDHLSPLLVDRPAVPGGTPYWARLARLTPLARVLVLYEELIERLDQAGVDIAAERARAAELRQLAAETPDDESLYLAARLAKRELFFRDPALAPLERILFAKRHPYLESHNYSEHLDGMLEPGGGVFVLNVPRDAEGRLRPEQAVVKQLFDGSDGIVREPAADFEAQRIYFAYRPNSPQVEGWASYWHLYSMRTDGSELTQLTDGPYHDFDAVCLPDGGVAFNSTRCLSRFLCWRPQAYVLYRMEADGARIQRLSLANLSEWKPSVMQNGRILWTRSEYLDKGADFGHTLWSIRPDGTHPELVFGNNTPNCYSQAHEVPGSHELVCTLMSHGDHNGPIALIDLTKGPFATEAVTNITPDTRPQYQMSRSYDNTFRSPYPISRDHFLTTHNPDNQHSWGLYVIDRYGNRELLYLDPEISCEHPTLLCPRPRPPVPASSLDEELAAQGLGQFVVQDVYQGLGSTVSRGEAKYLQICQEVSAPLQPLSDGQFCADHPPFTDFYAGPIHLVHGPAPSFLTRTPNAPAAPLQTGYNWAQQVSEVEPGLYRVREGGGWPSYVAKTLLGTVPIAEDGSVNFLAPAGDVLYFQVLDEDFNELQRMRSVVQLQPGEKRGCIGCHEHRQTAPLSHMGTALLQPPQKLQPPPWGSTAYDYQRIVQPVLDNQCVECHNGTEPGRTDLRGTLDEGRVPASYRALIEGGWVHFFDFTYGMRHFKAEPMSFGTLQSPLWKVLSDEHHKSVTLSRDQRRALKAWIDLNCPLWPDYIFRPDRPGPQTALAR